MKTAEERINALAAIVPNDVVAFLKAHLCIKKASDEIFARYKDVFDHEVEINSGEIFGSNGGSKMIDFEDHIWHRACIALENWIYETYYEQK